MNEVPAPRGKAPENSDALREVGRILRRHRLVLVLSLLAGIAVGLAFASRRSPTYEASALILVEEERVPSLSALDLLSGAADARTVGTEMELLRSRAMAKAVVDSLALQIQVVSPRAVSRSRLFAHVGAAPGALAASYRLVRQEDGRFAVFGEVDGELGRFLPGELIRLPQATLVLAPEARRHAEIEVSVEPRSAAVESLLGSLAVEQPGREVNLIRVAYQGPDPELVRDVPNVLTARFMAQRERMQKSETRSTVSLLREQLDTVGVQLAEAEALLRTFREAEQVVDPGLEASTELTHLASLRAERATLEAERASLAGVLANLQTLDSSRSPGSPSPYRRLIAFPTLLRSETGSELLRSLTVVENERLQLASRRSADDPQMQILNARVEELERQLRGMATTYLQGLTSQIAEMDATLGSYRSRLAEIPAKEARFTQLSRRPQVLQEMYALLQTRLKEAEIAEAVEAPSVRVVDAADLPAKPVGPGRGLFAGVFGSFALLLAAGLVLAREYADTTIRTRADVKAALGLPVLALIPMVARSNAPRWRSLRRKPSRLLLAAGSSVSSAGKAERLPVPSSRVPEPERAAMIVPGTQGSLVDAYSRLHTNLLFARPEAPAKVLIFTSPLAGDGKTTTAVNFAASLAELGLKVLLIDADLRRGRVHEALGVEQGPGLTNLLSDAPELDGVLRRVEVGPDRYLRFVTSGRPVDNPVQLLGSPVMRELLQVVSRVYDRVIVDTPPLNLFPDAAILSPSTDGVVVVARAGVTPFDALVDTAEQLRHSGGEALGAVLNGVDFERDAAYDRAYRWYSQAESYTAA